jgi:uncharacterized protein DUF4270
MKKISLALYALAFGIVINSCNDPSSIGSELLDEDQVDVFYTDSFNLVTSTIKEDTILAYDPNPVITFDNFQFGIFNDPLFGKTEAGIYAQIIPSFDPPNFDGAILDSIILTLQYDSARTYGVLDDTPFGVGVYRIIEPIDVESKYYSNQTFQIDEFAPLAEISGFTPKIASTDSIKGVIDYTFDAEGDTIDIVASLRIPLSLDFGQDLIDNYDSLIYTSNTNFVEQLLNGLYVKPLAETPGMLSFDIGALSTSRMTLYYRRDTIKTQYVYGFSTQFVQLNNFKSDATGSIVDDFFNDTTKGDSLIFVQAMTGPSIKVEIPNSDELQNVIINKAELVFTVAELPEDDPDSYPPTNVLIATNLDTDGNYSFLSDILLGGANFGGIVIDEVGPQGESIKQYSMNISAYFQDIVDGREDNTIYLRAFPKQEKSSRSVIYGPGHSKYPMKLKLTYTKRN